MIKIPKRKYKTNKEKLLAEGVLIVSSTDDAKYQHRVEAVNLVSGGMKPSELSISVYDNVNGCFIS